MTILLYNLHFFYQHFTSLGTLIMHSQVLKILMLYSAINSIYRPTINSIYRPTINATYRPTIIATYRPTINSIFMPTINSIYRPATISLGQ